MCRPSPDSGAAPSMCPTAPSCSYCIPRAGPKRTPLALFSISGWNMLTQWRSCLWPRLPGVSHLCLVLSGTTQGLSTLGIRLYHQANAAVNERHSRFPEIKAYTPFPHTHTRRWPSAHDLRWPWAHACVLDQVPLPLSSADLVPLPLSSADLVPLPLSSADLVPLPLSSADLDRWPGSSAHTLCWPGSSSSALGWPGSPVPPLNRPGSSAHTLSWFGSSATSAMAPAAPLSIFRFNISNLPHIHFILILRAFRLRLAID